MTIPFKPRVAQTICRIDRKTQAVTANVNFEDIDLRINGEGSEVYDYEYMFVAHATETTLSYILLNEMTDYSSDRMCGEASTADANSISTVTYIQVGQSKKIGYPGLSKGKITGYIGNKRHIDVLNCGSDATQNRIFKYSYYTADTSTELTSFQLRNSTSETITYSLIITAVPKIQYNPHAILLKDLTLSSQTADIIFGGVNDTEGVDDLDGDVYDYVYVPNGVDNRVDLKINSNTANRIRQQLYNNNGSVLSANTTTETRNSFASGDGEVLISADIGRKKLTISTVSQEVATQQIEIANWDSDTSTKMTSLQATFPNGATSGNVQLYAVPKGYNADLTPWTFRQVVDIAGDFSAGHSFEIPDWAMFMKVDFVGESGSTFLSLDFNNLGVTIDRQYLLSTSSSTLANFGASNYIGALDDVSNMSTLVSLKNGANRPILSKYSYRETDILIQGLWAKDSSTVFTSAQIKASNANTINGRLVVSFI